MIDIVVTTESNYPLFTSLILSKSHTWIIEMNLFLYTFKKILYIITYYVCFLPALSKILILPSLQFVCRNTLFGNDMYDPTPPSDGISIDTTQ